MNPVIAVADIGSVKHNNFGWAILRPNKDHVSQGTCIKSFTANLVDLLDKGNPVALGFECPLFVPIRSNPKELTSKRRGEGNRPWSAAAGASALATGLTEVTWMLSDMKKLVNRGLDLSFCWEEFVQNGGLLLWEAFVSGKAKTNSHIGDAERAALAFQRSLPDPPKSNYVHEKNVLSLVGAAAMWAGWCTDMSVLKAPCLVLAAASD